MTLTARISHLEGRTDWQVQHLDPVEGVDGTYIIDVTVRFRVLGAD
jgi:hypothetical protein